MHHMVCEEIRHEEWETQKQEMAHSEPVSTGYGVCFLARVAKDDEN